MIEPPPLQQVDRTHVLWKEKKFSYFSGCDYFRLSSHPAILQALEAGVRRFGLDVAASRLTTGNHVLYERLEKRLAEFFDTESALTFSSGYAANLAVAQALEGSFTHVLIDERAHTSLTDAAQFLRRPIIPFRHRDAKDAAKRLRPLGTKAKALLLTDGLFSHDGSIAPLKEYLEILPANATILVDDAHGAGVLGGTGQGTPEHSAVPRKRIIQTITLSKAFGVYGGAVLGDEPLRNRIVARSHLFVGNTPLPLPLAAAALEAVRILRSESGFRRRLLRNVSHVKDRLRRDDFSVVDSPGPIISVVASNRREIDSLKRRLVAARIYPPLITYPGGPALGYFRFALSSEHSQNQLDNLISALMAHRRGL